MSFMFSCGVCKINQLKSIKECVNTVFHYYLKNIFNLLKSISFGDKQLLTDSVNLFFSQLPIYQTNRDPVYNDKWIQFPSCIFCARSD